MSDSRRLRQMEDTMKNIEREGVRRPDGKTKNMPESPVAKKAVQGMAKGLDRLQRIVRKATKVDERVAAMIAQMSQAEGDELVDSILGDELSASLDEFQEKMQVDPEGAANAMADIVSQVTEALARRAGANTAGIKAVAQQLGNEMSHALKTLGEMSFKDAKNLLKVATEADATGLLPSGSMLTDVKKGALHYKDYYINLGALFSSILMMKGLRYVTEVADDEGGFSSDSISLDNLTGFFNVKGEESFQANPKLASLRAIVPGSTFNSGTKVLTVGTSAITAAGTVAAPAVRPKYAEDKEGLYLCSILSQFNGSRYEDTMVMTGLDLANEDVVHVIADADLRTGTVDLSAVADGKIVVQDFQKFDVNTTKMRISGAVDLRSVASWAGFVFTTGLNKTAGALYPLFSNSIANIFTKTNLADFVSKKS